MFTALAPALRTPAIVDATQAARTVSFSTEIFPPLRGTALYPLISKVNHSCAPNCMPLWSRDCTARLVVTTALSPGDELTIDYLANGDAEDDGSAQATRRRRKWLRTQYGFECQCERCNEAEP